MCHSPWNKTPLLDMVHNKNICQDGLKSHPLVIAEYLMVQATCEETHITTAPFTCT